MVLIIAHRGFSSRYPENTLLAFKKAIELGVDWIELDVRLSLDHKLIVMHDRKLNRTTTGKGNIAWKTLEEIRKHHVAKRNQEIPTLEKVFNLIKSSKTKANVEIKTVWAAEPVANLIKKYKLEDKVIVSSGNLIVLRVVKKEVPDLETTWPFFLSHIPSVSVFVTLLFKITFVLTNRWVIMQAKKSGVNYINISYPFATKSFISRLHKNGLKVNVWTVNTKPLMKKLIKSGVDGIFTDYPDRLKKVISSIQLQELKKHKKKRFRLFKRRR